MLERKEYLDQLITWKDKQVIKVVTGVRRCGKSTLFSLYRDYLKSVGVPEEQIIFLNLEDLDYAELLEPDKLYSYVKKRLVSGRTSYVFLDEVQTCRGFEKAVDSLFIKPNVDVYITGSNAFLLSGELATLLSGRYVEIAMLPLSFREYWGAVSGKEDSKAGAFQKYLRYGSFPYVTQLEENDTLIKTYIEGIYNTILIKDAAGREGITDITLLESIIKTVASSIGSPISAKKIGDTLRSAGRAISVNTVERYLRALTESFIFYKADRYDIKGKQYLKTLGKYYIVDTGIRNLIVSSSSLDIGHRIENVVYLELLRRGYRVNVGKLAEKEVDFVASAGNSVTYYQVAVSVLDSNTLERELNSLMRIPDHYPKVLLTMDEIGSDSVYEGIRQLNLPDWLLTDRQEHGA